MFQVFSVDPANGVAIEILEFADFPQEVKVTLSSPVGFYLGFSDQVTDETGFYVPTATPVVLDGPTCGTSLYAYQVSGSASNVTAVVHYGQLA